MVGRCCWGSGLQLSADSGLDCNRYSLWAYSGCTWACGRYAAAAAEEAEEQVVLLGPAASAVTPCQERWSPACAPYRVCCSR
jgi:hypothetical protein